MNATSHTAPCPPRPCAHRRRPAARRRPRCRCGCRSRAGSSGRPWSTLPRALARLETPRNGSARLRRVTDKTTTQRPGPPAASTASSGSPSAARPWASEVRGGLVTFLTMAYIIVLNPLILGFVPDSTGAFLGGGAEPGSGIPAIAAGTALVAGLLTILMGGVANFPLALATGLGLNAFVANSIARQLHVGRRDGPGRPRGHRHPRAGPDRLPQGGLPRGPAAAQGRDLGRNRPVHRPHRLRRRRLRHPHPRRVPDHRPGPARRRRPPGRAGRCSSSASAWR